MPHRKRHEEDQDPSTSTQLPDEPVDAAPEDRTSELERLLEEANNERLRAIADFQNFRRRTQQEMSKFRQLAAENLVSALIPVLDNFERTVQHLEAGADAETMMTGIRAVEKQLRSVLQAQDLQRIPAAGEVFDPELHEAVATVPTDDYPDHTIIEEIEPGYRLGDRVIRPARVRVARPA